MALSICYWTNYVNGKAKLMRKSENAVNSNHVLKFIYDKDCLHVKSVVQASMKDKSYKVEIDLDQFFGVSYSSCECPLGNFMCHHVAAALLFGYKRASKTDVKCSWLSHPKSLMRPETKTIDELFPSRKPLYSALNRGVTDSDRNYLYEELGKLGRFTGLHWILSPEPVPRPQLVPCVEDLILSNGYMEAHNRQTWLRRQLSVSPAVSAEVERLTVGQRQNPFWSSTRKNRITASNFGAVLAAIERNRFPVSLKKRLMSIYNLDAIRSIAWGISQESSAIEMYCRLGAKVEACGIWLHESGVLGASPDGLVLQPPSPLLVHHQNPTAMMFSPELLEVKCPFSAKDGTVEEAIETVKGFYLVRGQDGVIRLRENHDYYHQIQGQLYITGKACCDLVVMTTRGIEVIRIAKDSCWQSNINKLINFFYNIYISYLVE